MTHPAIEAFDRLADQVFHTAEGTAGKDQALRDIELVRAALPQPDPGWFKRLLGASQDEVDDVCNAVAEKVAQEVAILTGPGREHTTYDQRLIGEYRFTFRVHWTSTRVSKP